MPTHTEDQFHEKFTIVPWTFGEYEAEVRDRRQIPDNTPTHNVFTAVDGEGDHGINLVPGYLTTEDYIYYIITEEAWTDADKDNVYAWVTDADFDEEV